MGSVWRNLPISGFNGAAPEMHQRTRPPRAAWTLANTSLVASLYLRARRVGIGLFATLRSLTSRPTLTAQLKIFSARPPLAWAVEMILVWTFS